MMKLYSKESHTVFISGGVEGFLTNTPRETDTAKKTEARDLTNLQQLVDNFELPRNKLDRLLEVLFGGRGTIDAIEMEAYLEQLRKHWDFANSSKLCIIEALLEPSKQLRDTKFHWYVDFKMRREIVVEWCRRYAAQPSNDDWQSVLQDIRSLFMVQRLGSEAYHEESDSYRGMAQRIARLLNDAKDPDLLCRLFSAMIDLSHPGLRGNMEALAKLDRMGAYLENEFFMDLKKDFFADLSVEENLYREPMSNENTSDMQGDEDDEDDEDEKDEDDKDDGYDGNDGEYEEGK
ncbi:hypothetical protein NLG97_g7987 [Lecanicillium saksenae]|uniref:Uncharacterized protein n=1 Tax=Lecanicillium saksenae TaxID=468837 RepID=A0ACC1QLD9_9HYPO|nr:hypothetical protein NLG97_g7987 [Lecanicillium saksenae]